MQVVDTHTHLYLPEFDSDSSGKQAVERAIDAGVTHLVMPNIDTASLSPLCALASLFPNNVSIALGLHPTEVGPDWQRHLAQIFAQLDAPLTPRCVAIGEIGMDLYWDKTHRELQMLALEQQLLEAKRRSLPAIIHCREALDETLEVMCAVKVPAVMHCFCGTPQEVEQVRRQAGDVYFGIGGVATFKNSRLQPTLQAIGAERIVLETDSPYLAPVPHRGKRNESAYIINTLRSVAAQLGLTPEQLAQTTTANAHALFTLPAPNN